MKKLWGARVRPQLPRIGLVVLILALVLIGANGYRVAASKPNDSDLAAEYDEGYDAGRSAGEVAAEADAADRVRRAKGKAYWNGWEEGQEEGEESGRRLGAEQATPNGVDFQTRYMVTYEPGPNGPVLRGFLEMPLNTVWACEDLDGCTEYIE